MFQILLSLVIINGNVKGRILEKGTYRPVEYAVVIVKNLQGKQVGGTYTDSNGVFIVQGLKKGKYIIVADFIGYKSSTSDTFNLTGELVDVGTIYLEPTYIKASPVKVTAKSPRVRRDVDRTIVTPSQDIISSGGNASDVLRNVPGITVSVNGEILIKNSKNYTVLINNKPSLLPPSQVLKEIPASQIERIEIITNPSAEYDPESNAIINIVLRKSRYKVTNSFSVRFGTFSNYGISFTTGALKKHSSLYIIGNMSKYSQALQYKVDIKTPTDTVSLDRTNFTTSDFPKNIRLGAIFDLSKTASFTLEGELGKYDLEYYGDFYYQASSGDYFNPIRARWKSDFYSVSAEFSTKFSKGNLNTSAYFGNLKTNKNHIAPKIENGDTTGGIKLDGNGQLKQFRYDLSFDRNIGKVKLSTGLRYDYKRFSSVTTTQIFGNSLHENPLKSKREVGAGFIKFKTKSGRFSYSAGLRTEYLNRRIENLKIEKWDIFPSFYISTNLSSATDLSLSYSRRIRRPSSYSLNPVDVWETSNEVHKGNPALRPQYNDSYEISLETPIGKKFFLNLSGYYLNQKDFFNKVEEVGDSGVIVKKEINFPYKKEMGANFNLDWRFSRFLKFTLSPDIHWYDVKKPDGGEDKGTFYMVRAMFQGLVIPIGFIQLVAQYIGPYDETFGRLKPTFATQFGYMIQIKNIMITIALTDALHTTRMVSTNNSSRGYVKKEMRIRYPHIWISIRYINRKLKFRSSEYLDKEDIKSM